MFFSEILPLVEFVLEDDITDQEAIRLIETPVDNNVENSKGWEQEVSDTHQTLRITNDTEEDPFTSKFGTYEVSYFILYDFIVYLRM